MRKFLGVSLVAVLAVSPMMAQADVATVSTNDTTVGVASTKYVKEAYNAMAGAVNTALSGKQNVIDADHKLAASNVSGLATVATSGKSSDLTNDAGFITKSVNDLTNYTTTTNMNTALNAKVTNAGQFTASTNSGLIKDKTVVAAIQDTAAAVDGKVTNAGQFTGSTDSTLVKSKTVVNAIKDTAAAVDAINSAGYITKDVNNLTNYTTTTDMNTALSGKQNVIDADHKLAASNVSGLATVATSGKSSDLTNDAGFITKSVNDLTNYTTTTNMNTALNAKVTNAGQFTADSDSALIKTKTVVNAIKDTAAAVDGKVTNAGQFTGSTDSTLVKSKTVVNAIKDTAAAVDAINSAGYITKDVSNLTNYTTTTDMNTALSGKQDTLSPGNGISISGNTVSVKATSSGSGLSVTSSGVKVAADAANINSNAVTTAKIADSNVTTAKIADLNVTTGKLAASAVTTAKIADSNVTTAKIADGAVTAAKLGAEIQLYSGWNSGGTPTANPTTVALVAPVHGS